ncbi:unnamed protein product [Candidula unifasciata]|uniref:Protein kinase domain-containing protein n=1 Tax=Candidula unifasciata TaxID=100452 RepID=A0A8S3YFN9_9EUPU|nr:unnamed protein product [Candidula unifasciata]
MTRKDLRTDDNKRLTVAEIDKRLKSFLGKRYLPKDCLTFSYKRLGSGHYGAVYEGHLRHPEKCFQNTNGSLVPTTPVAVKLIKTDSVCQLNRKMVYQEIKVACELDHPNVVKLLYLTDGAYLKGYDQLMMVMEYMNKGSLSEYAKKYGELSNPEKVCHMLKIMLDVAEGMVYLSGKDIIHRDLAARNVLLTKVEGGGVRAKVSDFGLARILEGNYKLYRVNKDELPFPWMPPECLVLDPSDPENIFSSKGDVWSFGILMWESFSEGTLPKKVLKPLGITDGEKLLAAYKSNWRLPGDIIRCKEAYNLMTKCWQMEPNRRPAFVELVQELKHLISKLEVTKGGK